MENKKSHYERWLESNGHIPKVEAPKEQRLWEGGEVDENDTSGGYMTWVRRKNSSGEPHTNDQYSDSQPTAMSTGGIVRKDYSRPERDVTDLESGGVMARAFAKALKKRRQIK